MLIGIDFDNTIVSYDRLFHELAMQKGLISEEVKPDKVSIREYLNNRNKGDEFTKLQGEVYGKEIERAIPCIGVENALRTMKRLGHELIIISHKTKYPYKGIKYNLHEAAWRWLNKHKFTDASKLDFNNQNVIFKEKLEDKVKLINNSGCDVYIDDLEVVLNNINKSIKRVHYDIKYRKEEKSSHIKMSSWNQLEAIISK